VNAQKRFMATDHILSGLNLPPLPLMLAFAVEAALFLALAWPRLRRWPRGRILALLACAAFLPYLIATWRRASFADLAVLALLGVFSSLWLVAIPRNRWSDLTLLAALAAVFLSPAFREVYGSGAGVTLGRAMWIRSGIAAFLLVAREPGIGFGFWPSSRDWLVGLRYFALFLIPGLGLGWALGYLSAPEFRPLAGLGMFLGSLWFVALSEEFFFRGLLQRWLGLPAASALFGLAHLGFRQFPNWRHVAITIVLGVFCGLAYRRAGSIRAAMVTHSLVNALWVGLLGKL
jgi:membrane protease YdiL (CAAX protease family)